MIKSTQTASCAALAFKSQNSEQTARSTSEILFSRGDRRPIDSMPISRKPPETIETLETRRS